MIIRRKHNANFTVVPNAVINDERLSLESMGLLTYLLSRPDNWHVNVQQLAKHWHIGKNKAYALVISLIESGYITRGQRRTEGNRQFNAVEYTVHDMPVSSNQMEPVPENRDAENSPTISNYVYENSAETQVKAASLFSASPKQGRIIKTDLNKREAEQINSASNDAGASAPSVSATVWKEGQELLKLSCSRANPSIIGKWLKRIPTDNDKQTLLQIFRAARNAGSGDPVAYVTRVVNDKFPLPADPKAFDAKIWERNIKAAIKTRAWAAQWGPAPGIKGCMIPPGLVTRDLLAALQIHEMAA